MSCPYNETEGPEKHLDAPLHKRKGDRAVQGPQMLQHKTGIIVPYGANYASR
jgi:hypothetical protein